MQDSLVHSIAAGAAGFLAMTATYPLIFLSTRSQVDSKNNSKAIMEVIKREGILGLYSGLGSSLLGVVISNGVYYYFYERSREVILRSRAGSKALSTAESIIIGLIAGSATTIISNPIWVIQTSQAVETMESDNSPSTKPVKKMGFFETIRRILAQNGIAAFWRGLGPALVLVINPVIQYTMFEQLKNLLVARRIVSRRAGSTAVSVLTDWDFFFLGAIGKLAATSSTYPYIVIKSRLQAGHARALQYKSSFDGLLAIIKEEGIQGLYKGIGSKLLQSVLTAAILFACQRRIYEIMKRALVQNAAKR